MIISYRTPPGSGSWTVLATESGSPDTGERISGYAVPLKQEPQTERLALSATSFVANRGNSLYSLRFRVDRQHASPDAALSFAATHPAAMGALGTCDIQVVVGSTTLVLGVASLTELTPEPHSDMNTVFNYSFVGSTYG